MKTTASPPTGSTIQEIRDFDATTYKWRQPNGGVFRYFVAAFISFWLCGWAFGLVMVIGVLIRNEDGAPQLFLLAWLGAWIIGGIAVISFLWRLLRPLAPESTTMTISEFRYDSGTPPVTLFINPFNPMRRGGIDEVFHGLTRRRKKLQVPKSDIRAFELERVGERQRLYFDHGADRIEIGRCLKEPEREWLVETLQAWLKG